jgi:putative tryptophan/tyrosine transport system substrate-binding protein
MLSGQLKRREFITLLGGAAASWPLVALAQREDPIRHVAVLLAGREDDPDLRARLAGLRSGLERLGWFEGRNIRITYRFAEGRPDRFQPLAKELVAQHPELIVAQTPPVVAAVRRETSAIAIVFVDVADPFGPGFIVSLARPGSNVTGLVTIEASIAGKWLAMLKEIAPDLARVVLLGNPKTTSFDYFQRSAEALAPSLAIELVPGRIETEGDIERAIESIARVPHSGLALPPDSTTILHRDLVIGLAARLRLPAVYPFRLFVAAGGLMSYSIDFVYEYRQAASYVDRILHGANPGDIPVQTPTRFETVLNLKTAKALGVNVPPGLLVAADEVIE